MTTKKENGLGCGRRHLALVLVIVGALVGVMLTGWTLVMASVEKKVSNHELRMRALETQGVRAEEKLDYISKSIDEIKATLLRKAE